MDNNKNNKKKYNFTLADNTKNRLEELSQKNNLSKSLIIDILVNKQKRDYIF